jgi:uncharacterized protein (DUF924 family)
MGDLVKRLTSLADCDARAGEPLGKAMRDAAARLAAQDALLKEMAEALAKVSTDQMCRCMYISRDTERAYENGACVHQSARATLAKYDAMKEGRG